MKNSPADEKLFITRKRKKYKFAKFDELENCFQFDEVVALLSKLPKMASRQVFTSDSLIKIRNNSERKTWDADIFGDFENSTYKSLIIEIGAGTGLFSVELARRHPENFYMAIDIKSDRLYTGARLANELKLKNIIFIRSDIWRLKELFQKNSVSEIWITFPDPYATEDQTKLKKSDAKHRLTHPRFLEIYKQLLQAQSLQGKVHFKTDNKPLFEWSKEQFEENNWDTIELTEDLHNSNLSDDYKIKTSYEERFTAEGLPIYLLTAKI